MSRHRGPRLAWAAALATGLAADASAGEIDRLDGPALARLAAGEGADRRAYLSVRELDALPPALGDTPAALLVVRTGEGNLARLLATRALRKPAGGDGPPAPVLVLERLDAFEPGRAGARRAAVAGLVLFDGFRVDLDAGLVVPPGQGGDLEFRAGGDAAGGVLSPTDGATLWVPSRPVARPAAAPGPSAGKAVLPGDFAGRWRLDADGRFAGALELEVGDDRQARGRFRSEPGGATYQVTGEVAADPPHRLAFRIQFPRAVQEYDAYLATGGKNALAGTFTMLDRTYGFSARREPTAAP